MTSLLFRATIERERTPLSLPRVAAPPPSRVALTRATVSELAWITPAILLAWPRADALLFAFIAVGLAGAIAVALVSRESSGRPLSLRLVPVVLVAALDLGHLGLAGGIGEGARSAAIMMLGAGELLRTWTAGSVLQGWRARRDRAGATVIVLLAAPIALGSWLGLVPALIEAAIAARPLLRRG